MTTKGPAPINPLSARSLYLNLTARDQELSIATGFVVKWNDQPYLITNRHVVSGRHPETNKVISPTAAVPDEIRITHHGQHLGKWVKRSESLLDGEGSPRWLEHRSGGQVDVVALPLHAIDDQVKLYYFDLSLADADMIPEVAMPVSIIGFPKGLVSSGMFPIWKTGHIASDHDLDYQGKPAFLIDATTREGMSGSPVVLRLLGGYTTKSGATIMTQSRPKTRFLGIYSGRIHRDSEIGIVWRPRVITEILDQVGEAKLGAQPHDA